MLYQSLKLLRNLDYIEDSRLHLYASEIIVFSPTMPGATRKDCVFAAVKAFCHWHEKQFASGAQVGMHESGVCRAEKFSRGAGQERGRLRKKKKGEAYSVSKIGNGLFYL